MTDISFLPPGVSNAAELARHYSAVRKRIRGYGLPARKPAAVPQIQPSRVRDWLIVASIQAEPIPLRKVFLAAVHVSGLAQAEFCSPRRSHAIVHWRQAYYYVARKVTGASFPRIARAVGRRDHTTVQYGINQVSKDIKRFASRVNAILTALGDPELIALYRIQDGDTAQ